MATLYIDRIAEQARRISLVRLVLIVLAAPFWTVGAIIGAVWLAAVWCGAAIAVGINDVRTRLGTDRTSR